MNVPDTHITEDERDDVARAMQAAANPHDVVGWPIVADVLRLEVLRLRAELAGVSVGCAATTGAPVNPEQTTVHAEPIVSGVTDGMAAKGADAISDLLTMLGVDPDERQEHGGPTTAGVLSAAVLGKALAGCAAVQLPEPTATDEDDDPAWIIPGGGQIVACVIEGQPFVVSDPPSFRPLADRVEKYALRLLAAAREARRLSGSVSLKGDTK